MTDSQMVPVAQQSNMVPPAAGAMVRQDFGGSQMERSAETASSAAVAQAQAAIQARYLMAMRNPRDYDTVRVRLLKECKRPSFAEVALYRKPIGKGVEGLSIRFVEAALRCMGNLLPEVSTVYDDAEKRIVRVSVTDLETNVTYTKDLTIDKTVERNNIKPGQEVIRQRMNSYGKMTYLVPATEDDLLNKEGALVSKAIRTLGMRLIPGDLQDEAEAEIRETMNTRDAKDPDAARKRVIDAFAGIGIMPSELKEYLGHEVGASNQSELQELRGIFAAIKAGETSWRDAAAAKKVDPESAEAEPTTGATKADGLKAKIRGKAAPAATSAPTPASPPAETDLEQEEPGAKG